VTSKVLLAKRPEPEEAEAVSEVAAVVKEAVEADTEVAAEKEEKVKKVHLEVEADIAAEEVAVVREDQKELVMKPNQEKKVK
jgi:hypothetical protein